MSKNIFEIWKEIGEKVPFAVRRDNWTDEFYTIVESVEIKKWPYGTAKGYPTVNGHPSNHYDYHKKWRDDREIPNAGCYQWTYVQDAILDKKKPHEKKVNEPIDRNTSNKKQSVLDENSVLEFGKYKGKTVAEIFSSDAGYIKWMIEKVTSVALQPQAFRNLQHTTGGTILDELTFKVNDFKYRMLK